MDKKSSRLSEAAILKRRKQYQTINLDRKTDGKQFRSNMGKGEMRTPLFKT